MVFFLGGLGLYSRGGGGQWGFGRGGVGFICWGGVSPPHGRRGAGSISPAHPPIFSLWTIASYSMYSACGRGGTHTQGIGRGHPKDCESIRRGEQRRGGGEGGHREEGRGGLL